MTRLEYDEKQRDKERWYQSLKQYTIVATVCSCLLFVAVFIANPKALLQKEEGKQVSVQVPLEFSTVVHYSNE